MEFSIEGLMTMLGVLLPTMRERLGNVKIERK